MGNSALEKRNIGKIVVSDNNSNGVAEAINKYVLKKHYKNVTEN